MEISRRLSVMNGVNNDNLQPKNQTIENYGQNLTICARLVIF
jgi:hypothetical protein